MNRKDKFFHAIKNNDITVIKNLLEEKFSFSDITYLFKKKILKYNFYDTNNCTVFFKMAMNNKQPEMVLLLLKDYKINLSYEYYYPNCKYRKMEISYPEIFNWAVRFNHTEIIEFLLTKKDINPSVDQNYALRTAAEFGHSNLVSLFLNNELVNIYGLTDRSIVVAAKNNHIKVVEILLNDKRINPMYDFNSAICIAFKLNNFKIIEILWNDKRVKNSLQKDRKEIYEHLINKDFKTKIQHF
jgi:ankyrin repeat protein